MSSSPKPEVIEVTAESESLIAKTHDKQDKKDKPVAVATQEENESGATSTSRWPPKINAWSILFIHAIICLAIALGIALAVNGYKALDDHSASHAQYVAGKLILRVGDVTTLISAALVIVKLLVSSWTTLTVWACGHHILYNASQSKTGGDNSEPAKAKDVSFMMRWKLPAWIKTPFAKPSTPREWVISIALLIGTLQAFISPVLTGSVNWTSTPVPATDTSVPIAAVDTRAYFGNWYWYTYKYTDTGLSRRPYLRTAAGYASMVWSDVNTVSKNGTSLTGNGCRRVVTNSDTVGPNSTLLDAVIPCIKVNSIKWYNASDVVSRSQWVYVADSSSLSIVGDSPSKYYVPGATVVFDPNSFWNDSQNTSQKPAETIYTGVRTVGMMVNRVSANQTPECSHLDPTIFGSVDSLGRYFLPFGDATNKNCYLIGTVNFTAGVTASKESTYVSGRVVEDQTPLDQVAFKADPWVQESLWMLPDLMTMIAIMNSTLLPTYDNIDGYVETLLRQAYLGAWDTYHNSFDEDQKNLEYTAIPSVSRQLADVTFWRVFLWMAISLLMTLSGGALLVAVLKTDDLKLPEDKLEETKGDRRNEEVGMVKDMVLGLFFNSSG
ncbi:hypothetical protein V8E54_009826 [Elaphomyces granulatus]|jgi:hypothetical protein